MESSVKYCFERYEKKYFITPAQQQILLNEIQKYIKPDIYSKYTICSIYYDTDDWRLIRASIEKGVYKEKLRVRSYGVPDKDGSVFIELKRKYDGVVYKRRITVPAYAAESILQNGIPNTAENQIGNEINWFQHTYKSKPKVFIAYDRTAFTGVFDEDLRITFDSNIRWRDRELDLRAGDWGSPVTDRDSILMEIKLPGVCPLWLGRVLSDNNIFPTSFSKYGTCYRNNILKRRAAV